MNHTLGLSAFIWGIVSAVSLPMGALLGLWLKPSNKINSAFMAFGAGALIFALTIELFGHVPHHVHEHGVIAFVATLVGALSGGILFDSLNVALNNRGAFLRKLSQAKQYVGRLKLIRVKKMLEQLSHVELLRVLSHDEMAQLIHLLHKKNFSAGEKVFSQGDDSDAMYFIVSGDVEVVLHDAEDSDTKVATLGEGQVFGEMGLLTGSVRVADVRAISDVYTYKIHRSDFEMVTEGNQKFHDAVKQIAQTRLSELKEIVPAERLSWIEGVEGVCDKSVARVSYEEIKTEHDKAASHGGAAMAIWLGILIDSIPESLVIGMLAVSDTGMSLAFIVGVFLANLPEAMSSSVTLKHNGIKIPKILLMWGSIVIVTGIGAYVGAVAFPPNPEGATLYFVLGIEALAAGAMLTMIAETMLPEAFEQGGAIVGLSSLFGFLSALAVKVLF
jgi:zinc transporter ZupT